MTGDIRIRIPGNLNLPTRFFGMFTTRQLLRAALLPSLMFLLVYPPHSVLDAASLLLAVGAGLVLAIVNVGDVSLPAYVLSAVRWTLQDRMNQRLEPEQSHDRIVPHAVFTDPQVGRVGLTEQQARDAGYEVAVGQTDYAEQGKPNALGETEGFVKIISDAETDEILGCHIVGEGGANIIHEVVVAMRLGGTAQDIADTIHIHPTLPEVINSAAGGVHKPS